MSVRYINNPVFLVDEESLPAEIQTLFKVDSLQQQAEMTQNALKAVKQVIVKGGEEESKRIGVDENTMEEDAGDEEDVSGKLLIEIRTYSMKTGRYFCLYPMLFWVF